MRRLRVMMSPTEPKVMGIADSRCFGHDRSGSEEGGLSSGHYSVEVAMQAS